MADEDEKARKDAEEEKARTDAARWDKVMGALDSICSRMDAFEEKEKAREDKARRDAEEEEKAKKDAEEAKAKADAEEEEKAKADKAKKDAEDEEKAKADALARADAALAKAEEAKAKADALASHISGTEEDRDAFGKAQARADAVYLAHGKQAPAPMVAEKAIDYRRRLLSGIQATTPAWKDADFKSLAAGALFDELEARVYADAEAAARDPSTAQPGQLRRITRKTEAGHTVHEYVGTWRDGAAGLIQPFPKVGQLKRNTAA